MSSSFDPYQQWLGIPKQEQPPDCYRLLGVPRYESDPSAIRAAADARMGQIRAFQVGPRAAYTQPLLNELAAAKILLLNPVTKAQYDEALAAAASLSEAEFTPDLLPSPSANREAAGADAGVDSFLALAHRRGERVPNRTELAENSSDRIGHRTEMRWRLSVGIAIAIVMAVPAYWILSKNSPAIATNVPTGSDPDLRTTAKDGTDKAKVVLQQPDGNLTFPAAMANLLGAVQLQSASADAGLVGWSSSEDEAVWKFKVLKLPSQGMFRIRVNYQSAPGESEAKYVISMDSAPRLRDIRAASGELHDEFFLAVPRTGEHTLSVKINGAVDRFVLQSVELSFPKR